MIYFTRVISLMLAVSAQYFLADELSIFGVIPNLMIGFILFWNMSETYYLNMCTTFIAGLAFDVLYPQLFGVGTFSYLVIAFIVYVFHSSISKNRVFVVFLSVLFINFVFFLFYCLTSKAFWVNGEAALMCLFGFLYNTVITFLEIYVLCLSVRMKISFNETY